MPDREELIDIAYDAITEGIDDRDEEEARRLPRSENVAKAVDAILAALKPDEQDCPGCGAPNGYPPAGPCIAHGTPHAVADTGDWPDDEAVERAAKVLWVQRADVQRADVRAALLAAGPHVVEHWVCDDGDVFPTHEAAVEHMRMVDAGESSEVECLRAELAGTRQACRELTTTCEGLLGDRERAMQSDHWRIKCDDLEAEVERLQAELTLCQKREVSPETRMMDASVRICELERERDETRAELQRIRDEAHRTEGGMLTPSWSDDLRQIEGLEAKVKRMGVTLANHRTENKHLIRQLAEARENVPDDIAKLKQALDRVNSHLARSISRGQEAERERDEARAEVKRLRGVLMQRPLINDSLEAQARWDQKALDALRDALNEGSEEG